VTAIAEHLNVERRSVSRYLAAPCPERPGPQEELASFYMDGACYHRGDLDWFCDDQDDDGAPDLAGISAVKAVCAKCPVLVKCRNWGLSVGREEAGIWGGLTTVERRTLRGSRQRACQQHGAA
jgi:WhiB family transcriptional regulator, redox-sensing transcriptional regulator